MITSSNEQKIQLLLPNKFITHHPKFGVNPLVDAAAYLFSLIGKLKQLENYHHLSKLQKELLLELKTFHESATAQGYLAEYIFAARYALAATLDDIISNTSWGSQGNWDNFSILTALNQDPAQDRFFVILERLSKDPAPHIDVLELMYICLSLGYKGSYRATEFTNNQLEQITHILYKNIRALRGDFSKMLSPFPIKTATPLFENALKKVPIGKVIGLTFFVIIILFAGLSILLDSVSKQAYQELLFIGKILLP